MTSASRGGERPKLQSPELGVVSPLTVGRTSTVLHLYGQIRDPMAHTWGLAQHLKDVSHDEIVRAAAAAFGG
jgi:hypothetical protein